MHHLRPHFICLFGLVFSLLLGDTRGATINVRDSLESNEKRALFPRYPDLYEATIAELQEGMAFGFFSSVDLVKVSLSIRLILVQNYETFFRPTLLVSRKSI